MIGYKHHFSLLSPQYTATSYHSVQHEIKSSYSLPITHTSALLSQVTCIPFFSPFLFFLRKKRRESLRWTFYSDQRDFFSLFDYLRKRNQCNFYFYFFDLLIFHPSKKVCLYSLSCHFLSRGNGTGSFCPTLIT